VITGIGAITPLGRNVRDMWKNLIQSRSGISAMTLFDSSTFPTRIAAEIKNLDFTREFPSLEKNGHLAHLHRHGQFALMAAWEAYQDSQLSSQSVAKERMGIYFASGEGAVDFINFANCTLASLKKEAGGLSENGRVDKDAYIQNSRRYLNGIKELEQEPAMTVYHLAEFFCLRGPVFNCLTACAASSQAIGEACEIIRRGEAEIMMSGGTHSMIHPLGVIGFNLLTALSVQNDNPARASRPFDLKRDGFVIGEGSGVVILEELEHAKRRGAPIYGELTGYGSTADAYRLTDTHPTGRGAIVAMQLALKDAGYLPDQIQYINAHGTSTAVNDSIESLAIREVFGETAKKIPVSSIKSMLGHLIAAAGVVELITCLLVIRDGIIPPTINLETPDPTCDLDYVPNQARKAQVDRTLSNSFGFGGQNITLVAERYPIVVKAQ
jgi:3-oxoacyl-[acyl-carrier-protein] synthase II